MAQGLKLLVLAGSAEARQIATLCQGQGAMVRAVVSEPPKGPNPMPVPCQLLDFTDPSALHAAMTGHDAVIDASHGFDGTMSAAGAKAAAALGVPFVSYQRPGWSVAENPLLTEVADVPAAMALITPSDRLFSAAGWASLSACAGFPGDRVFLRQTTPHSRPAPYDFITLSFDTPPFDVAGEVRLFKALGITCLMCRNLGGQASRPKVDAALSLGLRVYLIARPPLPKGVPVVQAVDDALAWVAAL